ncbi:MAG: hypothetical protein VYC39_06985 [Myxococcota bacterium]|nr:hypothetical protein [Myxococcota bacterium]
MPKIILDLSPRLLTSTRYVFSLVLLSLLACSDSASDLSTDAGTPSVDASILDAQTIPASAPCSGLFSGDVIKVPQSWENITCVVTSTNPCSLKGYQTRTYQICQSRGACEGVCPCGATGKDCVQRTLADVAPCELPAPTTPLQEGPWGTCETDQVCSLTGMQSRFLLVCRGAQTATVSESQSCSHSPNPDDLVTNAWGDCAYQDACVQTGTRTRQREICVLEQVGFTTDSESCSRSTEGLIVTERSLGACVPVDILDCSPEGTQTSTFSECVSGISQAVDASDSRAIETCDLSISQTAQVSISSASATTAQSQVEISLLDTVTASPTPAFDGQTRDFVYLVPSVSSSTPISPSSLVLTLEDGTELVDETGVGILASGDGLSTGTVDYQTGAISVQFSVAPQAGVQSTIVSQRPNDLIVTSGFNSSVLPLCRLTKVHGDLHLTIGSTVTSAAFDQLDEVYGNLTIEQISSSSPTSYDFSALQKIHGHLTIRSSYLNQISLPLLTEIGGDLTLSQNGGTSISMAQLTSVNNLTVGTSTGISSANTTLVRFDFPSLKTVNGNLTIAENLVLAAWSVDIQKVSGNLFINQPNIDTCTIYNSYVTPVQSQLGIDGSITVNFTDPSTNTNYLDSDGDGYVEQCDNCPGLFNPNQVDSDNDGIGDECEQ